MSHFILDVRTATPHFPGIGRYVANLAQSLHTSLAPGEQLTLLGDLASPETPGDSCPPLSFAQSLSPCPRLAQVSSGASPIF